MQNRKQILRLEVKSKLKELTKEAKKKFSHNLVDNLNPLIIQANKIAIYHALPIEICLTPFINKCLALNKQLYQPVAFRDKKIMSFIPYNAKLNNIFMCNDFIPIVKGAWYNLDLILIPLTAIDKFGNRLGKGGGYYDSTLVNSKNKSQKTLFCGVGYNFQLLNNVPQEEFDIKMHYFASDKELIKF